MTAKLSFARKSWHTLMYTIRGTYKAWPCFFHLSAAAVQEPPKQAVTKDAGKHQRTLTALTKLGAATAACTSNNVKKIEVWSQWKQCGSQDCD